ncbi:MAG: chloride channel protein, partial [Alphaproteobacteria bacterium]
VTQAPMTAFVVVLEITGRQSMPVPLIAASVIAAATSRIICPTSLYHALAKSFIASEVEHRNKVQAKEPASVINSV